MVRDDEETKKERGYHSLDVIGRSSLGDRFTNAKVDAKTADATAG